MADTPNTNDTPVAPAQAAPVAETTITPPEVTPATPDPKEFERLQRENKDLTFKSELSDVAKVYPHATEFSKEIKDKVEKGYSTTDAALIVLHDKGKLVAQAPQTQTVDRSAGMGGSMDTPPPQDAKDPAMGTPEAVAFYADKFRELEAKGEIRLA